MCAVAWQDERKKPCNLRCVVASERRLVMWKSGDCRWDTGCLGMLGIEGSVWTRARDDRCLVFRLVSVSFEDDIVE